MEPTFPDSTPQKTAQVAMTLAEIAYAEPDEIQTLLNVPDLATAARWQMLWHAADDANQVFIAQDRDTSQLAVAIRGTVTCPFDEAFWLDWFKQDLEAFEMDAWPYGGAPSGAQLASGTLQGMESLIGLRDASGQSIVDVLRANPPEGEWWTMVTGHSLGGALSSVMAPYLTGQLAAAGMSTSCIGYTFAAPSAGNAQLAQWLSDSYFASVTRYWNGLDVVPHSWADLPWIASSFPDNGPKIPDVIWGLVEGVEKILYELGDTYVQPGGVGMYLEGSIVQGDDWFYQAGAQHSGQNYLKLLGAQPVPFKGNDCLDAR